MHKIENEFLRVEAREYGAELISIYDKKNKLERLWNADEAFWPWHAPVLFPVVGRSLNDEIMVAGQTYKMEKHGFARKSNFKLLELGDSKMVFSLTYTDETLKIYPFKFEFLIAYRLQANMLYCRYEVINRDDKPLYFQLGGHPAFAVPPVGSATIGERYSDYHLEFESAETVSRHFINADGFFTGNTEKVIDNGTSLPLRNDLFKDDALIFKDHKGRKLTIKSAKNTHYLTVNFSGFPYLGLWAKVNAPYVCIEPWYGCADTVEKQVEMPDKEGAIKLPAGEEFSALFTVEIG
ncbi:MAG: aldose 1-epimerase family protein [Chitinophagales bacterium]